MSRSNAVPFTITTAPPLQGTGWEVRVLPESVWAGRGHAGVGEPLAVIARFVEATYSNAISEVGAGAVTLDMGDDLWDRPLTDGSPASTLLDHEHLWQIWEDGQLRAEFLRQTRAEDILSTDGGSIRAVTVGGPLGGAALKRGLVLTPGYPAGPPADPLAPIGWEFVGIPVMAAWLQLLAAAQTTTGAARFIQPTFTAAVDSAGEVWEDKAPPSPDPNVVVQVLSADVNFASDSATLTSAANTAIAAIAARLAGAHPVVTVVGHADSTNTHAYNQTLSENRAAAVRTALLALHPSAVVNASGRGETQPIATNSTSAGRAKNRRVTITYPAQDAPIDPPTSYKPPIGINLLDLLVELSGADLDKPAPVRVEWVCWPGFQLDVRREFGVHREVEVVFYEGSTNTVSKTRECRSDTIANVVVVRNSDGNYAVASDPESQARWGVRVGFAQPAGYDPGSFLSIARAMLERDKDERSTWTIVVADGPGRTAYVDYTLGDWIGISRYMGATSNVVEAHRVLAITRRVDADSNVTVELTLQTRADAYARKLQRRITSIINHPDDGTTVWIQDTEPLAAKVGDLWTPATPVAG